jgi:hypothetical protein
MFGAPGGPREHVSSESANTNYQQATNADLKYHTPEKYIPNDIFLAWVSARFPADRIGDRLNNDKPNKYSAYYQFGNNPLLQNSLVLLYVRAYFGGLSKARSVKDDHGSFA